MVFLEYGYGFWNMDLDQNMDFVKDMVLRIKYKHNLKYGFLYHVQFDKSIFWQNPILDTQNTVALNSLQAATS